MSFAIVREHPSLIAYVDALQKKNAEALSFYPRITFEREAGLGRLLLGLLDGEPCGYLYIGSGAHSVLRCHQVCIPYDARRRLYGAALVVAMEEWAVSLGVPEIALRCGADLDANDFWHDMGYVCIGHQQGGIRRRRTINLWHKHVTPALFDLQAVEPSRHKTDASLWRQHKQTGLVTQFIRGKAMRDYRALIENTRLERPA